MLGMLASKGKEIGKRMIEDKLSQDERIRLEALSQAIMLTSHKPSNNSEVVVNVASRFERFIKDGKK